MKKKIEVKREIATISIPKKLFDKYRAVVKVIVEQFDADQAGDYSLDMAEELVMDLNISPKHPCFSELSNEIADDLYRGAYRHTVTAIAEGA